MITKLKAAIFFLSTPPLIAGLSTALCITLLAYLNVYVTINLWLIPSFGASLVLITAAYSSPLAQPRNIFFGHIISSLCGFIVMYFFGVNFISIGLAVGLAVTMMMITKTVHPPAGANPIIIILGNESLNFLFMPIAIGAGFLVIYSILFNRFICKRNYPVK
jgi:CBS-domain-containing membrane protein|tara:strand:+ start:13 stop:498 length:486 start_codon:yes stop_codon:yes gene_type:complete